MLAVRRPACQTQILRGAGVDSMKVLRAFQDQDIGDGNGSIASDNLYRDLLEHQLKLLARRRYRHASLAGTPTVDLGAGSSSPHFRPGPPSQSQARSRERSR